MQNEESYKATQIYLGLEHFKKKNVMRLNLSEFVREMIDLEWKYRNRKKVELEENIVHARREIMILEKKLSEFNEEKVKL